MAKEYFKVKTDDDADKIADAFCEAYDKEMLKRMKEGGFSTVKEALVADGEWDSFVEDCEMDGLDPDKEISELDAEIKANAAKYLDSNNR